MNSLVAGERGRRGTKCSERLTGVAPPLDGAVVLLEHVIQIWHRPMPTILGQIAFGFELRNGGPGAGCTPGGYPPPRMGGRSAPPFCEKTVIPRPLLCGPGQVTAGGAGGGPPPTTGTPLSI